mmetsp:Transcript_50994/g.114745  ORF Transcript_50994/g.114745 Transcript_50994/m.114745 type:complete len:556 (-) Transcript_50994:43-1710(-)
MQIVERSGSSCGFSKARKQSCRGMTAQEDGVSAILAVQFIFQWIVAPIIAVNWCYIFKMSFPEYSEKVYGWFVYTVFIIFTAPVAKRIILARMQGHHSVALTRRGARLLLVSMTGSAVGTACSGMVALVFPAADASHRGFGVGLCIFITVVYIVIQAKLEARLESGAICQESYKGHLATTLLNGTWTTLGYFWNGLCSRMLVWEKAKKKPPPDPDTFSIAADSSAGNETLSDAVEHIIERFLSTDGMFGGEVPFRGDHDHDDDEELYRKKFETMQDRINGRPDQVSYIPFLWKGLITCGVGFIVLALLPDPKPPGEGKWWRRRFLLSVKMMAIIIPALSVNDCGYYFGMRVVGKVTTKFVGLIVAFIYAIGVTALIICICRCTRWKTPSVFAERIMQFCCWLACFAWWTPWQELLYQIQGLGFSSSKFDPRTTDIISLVVCTFAALLSTYVAAHSFARTLGKVLTVRVDSEDSFAEISELAGQDATIRFLAECSGIEVDRPLAREAHVDLATRTNEGPPTHAMEGGGSNGPAPKGATHGGGGHGAHDGGHAPSTS